MKNKLDIWCYGGKSKTFFIEQGEHINQYNAKMLNQILLIITIIISVYLAMSIWTGIFSNHFTAYLVCFIALLLLLCTFKLNVNKDIIFTRIYIFLFTIVMFVFVCTLGTILEPNTKASLFIVYVLVLPMLFIIPTHYIYGFLTIATCTFSIIALRVKILFFAQMDIINSLVCLVIGIFICRQILVSRMALYEANDQVNARNLQFENEIADRKCKQEELRLRLEQYQVIMNQTTDIIFEWDIRNDSLNFSSNWRKKFGYDPICSEISERIPLSENIHPDDMHAFIKIMKDTAAGKPYSKTEFRIKDSYIRYRWCCIRATAQFDDEGHAVKAIGVILDINAEKNQKQNLLNMAQHDALTGIYNKSATNSMVISRMNDFDVNVLQALLIIDVDYFKAVNDTYGHMAGDNVLSAIANQLKHHVRSGDVVGRIGGDEFLVYLSEIKNEDSALLKAKNLHAALGMLTPEPGAEPITSSIGMAVFPHGAVEYSDLYQYADAALYMRKDKGRNGVTVYDRHTCER